MGVEPPFLYDPPSRNSQLADPYYNFNPKAVTQASYAPRLVARSKKEGPLIDFNKHPDSYMIVSGSQQTLEPMHPGTKKKVVVTRWIQFGLRVVQLVAAVGLLICVIRITNTQLTQGWIIRIPPAWDAVINLYAVYHLIRPAKRRPAASSASYHFFALFMDAGLIPFYVFTALFANANWNAAPGTDGRWKSFFSTDSALRTLLLTTWLDAIVLGALHLISITFDLYLVIMFRKIARLPPDTNPLEDNLTSRGSSKHKHKNSELTLTSPSEKKLSWMTGSTLTVNSPTSPDRTSKDQLLSDANGRPLSFVHMRNDADVLYSGHTLESARYSQQQRNSIYDQPGSARASRASVYQQAPSAHASRTDLPPHSHSRTHSRVSDRSQVSSHSRSRSRSRSRHNTTRPSVHDPMPDRLATPLSYMTGSEGPSRYSTPNPGPQAAVPAGVAKLQQKESLLNDNWYVFEDSVSDLGSPRRSPVPRHSERDRPHDELAARYEEREIRDMLPEALRLSPTPKSHSSTFAPKTQGPVVYNYEVVPTPSYESEPIGRALTTGSSKSGGSSLYSDGVRMGGGDGRSSPKAKYYGDLSAATRGVRGDGIAPVNGGEQNGRVVSRSGADIADTNIMYLPEEAGARGRGRRDASGEVVKGWMGMRKREVSGVA